MFACMVGGVNRVISGSFIDYFLLSCMMQTVCVYMYIIMY